MTTTIQRTPILLEGPSDWEDWIEVIRTNAQARGILSLVDIHAATAPQLLKEPPEPLSTDIDPAAASYLALTVEQKDQFKTLLAQHRVRMALYTKQEKSVLEILDFINNTVARNLRTHIRGLSTPYEILKALKKRLAPTDRIRRLELAREYNALKKAPRAQALDKWLLQWETIFANAERLQLAEILDHKALYDFILAVKSVDPAYASAYQVYVDTKMEEGAEMPTLYDAIERFRNNLRLTRATKSSSTHTSFATLQGKDPAELAADSAPSSLTEKKKPPKCLCGEQHWYNKCVYLIEEIRPQGWTPNQKIQKKIDAVLAKNDRTRQQVERAQKRAKEQQKQPSELTTEQDPSTSTTLTSFALDLDSYELRDTWILDSGANSHVCNNPERFIFDRTAIEDDKLVTGKAIYPIEAFGRVIINVKTPQGPTQIQLLDVALVPGFFTNTASLHRFTAKGVHWDTEQSRLHQAGKTLCYVERAGSHWALEHNPLPTDKDPLSAFVTNSSRTPREDLQATARRWHAILGHPGQEAVAHLQQSVAGAVVTTPSTVLGTDCEPCALARAQNIISRRPGQSEPVSKPLERVAYDLIPIETAYNEDKWVSHFRCFVTGVDFVYTHRKKSQAIDSIKEFLNTAKTRFNATVRFIRTDGERTLGNKYAEITTGITTERSAPATPEQNGVAERSGGVLIRKARCLRIAANLPANLWPEIVKTTAYLNNRTPKRHLNWKTPYEALLKQKPNLSHLHAFGCRAYPLNKDIPRLQKLLPRAHIGYLIGYDSSNIYRIWIPSQEKVVRTRDVTFNEELFYNPAELDLGHVLRESTTNQVIEILEQPSLTLAQSDADILDNEDELLDSAPPAPPVPGENSAQSDSTADSTSTSTVAASTPRDLIATSTRSDPLPTPDSTPTPFDHSATLIPFASSSTVGSSSTTLPSASSALLTQMTSTPLAQATSSTLSSENRSDFDISNILPEGTKRTRTSTRREAYATALSQTDILTPFHAAFAAGREKAGGAKLRLHRDTLPAEPRSWKQMTKHKFSTEFKQAADREIQELTRKDTYKWINKNAVTATPLPLLWVFKYKFDTNGYLIKFKARLCVRGDLQVTEQDTYAATLAARTLRALMAIAAAFDLEIRQYDAVNAFINSKLNELIFCTPPEGYERLQQIWLLLRALYGLKQSPLLWHDNFSRTLEELGLHPIPGVNCLFASECLILFFYVDDIVVLFSKRYEQKFKVFEQNLLQRFEMRSLGELNWFLGIRIDRDRSQRKLWLCQDSYITKLAAKFNVSPDRKPPKTPLPSDDAIFVESSEQATVQQILAYQQRVGSANFAAAISRPDVAFSVSKLAQFLKNPSAAHTAAADHCIRYLCGTPTLAIEFCGQVDQQIFNCASDAAFADDSVTRRSSDGYLFQLYGGPIDWRAAKQKTVTTSSTEAELLSLSTAAKEVIWWNRVFNAIRFDTQQHTKIDCDNLQTIRALTKEGIKLATKLRHVDIHRHWLRQEIQCGKIALRWIPSSEMPADGLTKALPAQKHAEFVRQLNLVDIASRLAGEEQQEVLHVGH